MTTITTTTIIKTIENQNQEECNKILKNLVEYGSSDIDFKLLLDYLKNKNDSYSYCLYGHLYFFGFYVDRDINMAIKYYQLSADQDNIIAQNSLGILYRQSEIIDYQKSFNYFKLTADQNDMDGQYHLGYMYKFGLGVDIDFDLAKKYYQLSADQCHVKAKEALKIFSDNLSSSDSTDPNDYESDSTSDDSDLDDSDD